MYDTRRTVAWERDVLALNGFHKHVLYSFALSADKSNLQSDFCREGPLFLGCLLDLVAHSTGVLYLSSRDRLCCSPGLAVVTHAKFCIYSATIAFAVYLDLAVPI